MDVVLEKMPLLALKYTQYGYWIIGLIKNTIAQTDHKFNIWLKKLEEKVKKKE